MKVLKHGRYVDRKRPFVLECECGCEFETCMDECQTAGRKVCYPYFIYRIKEEWLYATCPECGMEIEISDENIRKSEG